MSESKPLYHRLADTLRQQILTHELASGQRLATEAELGATFGISRITVRQALAILAREGLIERFPGRGTFVIDRTMPGWELRSINDLVQSGKEVNTQVLSWRVSAPNTAAANFFGSTAPVWRMRAVRSQGSVPLYYVETFLRESEGHQLELADLHDHTLVELLVRKLKVPLGHAVEEICVARADAVMARHLWIERGQTVIMQRIDLFDSSDRPLQCGFGWWRSEWFRRRLRFHADLRDREEAAIATDAST